MTEKFHAGDILPDFVYQTPYETGVKLSETLQKAEGKTVLVFLRYLGCTSCQFEIRQYALNYSKITDRKAQMLVVLQSDPKLVAEQLKEFPLPFTIICDPEQTIYKEFELPVARDKDELHDHNSEKWAKKRDLVKASGLTHGAFEGNELQLPACFILEHDRKITYAHYGKSSNDNLSAAELAELL